ncbi:MAG: DUF3540 domain-containing protein [Pseudomonadota bacterium]
MNPIALKQDIPQPTLEYGRVIASRAEGALRVATSFGAVDARRAVSCLVDTRPGDTVLLSVDDTGNVYILSVLEREADSSEGTALSVDGNLQLHARNGSLQITADDALGLTGNMSIEVTTQRLGVTSKTGEVVIEKLALMGRTVYQQARRIVTVAKSVEQNFRHLTQRLKNTERYVEEHEEIQTDSTRYLVKDTFTTHAGNTLNISEELHTMQAEQIHMG